MEYKKGGAIISGNDKSGNGKIKLYCIKHGFKLNPQIIEERKCIERECSNISRYKGERPKCADRKIKGRKKIPEKNYKIKLRELKKRVNNNEEEEIDFSYWNIKLLT